MSIEYAKKIVVATMLLVAAAMTWSSKIDAPAMEQVDAGLKRALVAFASARALNAAISMAQGTEVSLGIGAGVTLSIGEVLDPANDLVERFSDFMLMATVAFGIQKVLLLVGQYDYIKLVLVVAIVGWGAVYLTGRNIPAWLSRVLIIMLMARFAIPMVTVGTDVIFKQFLEKDYKVGLESINNATSATKEMPVTHEVQPESKVEQQPPKPPQGEQPKKWWKLPPVFGGPKNESKGDAGESNTGIGGWIKDRTTGKLEALGAKIDAAVGHVIKVIVVFLLQTLLIPLALLWALFSVARGLIYAPLSPKDVQ